MIGQSVDHGMESLRTKNNIIRCGACFPDLCVSSSLRHNTPGFKRPKSTLPSSQGAKSSTRNQDEGRRSCLASDSAWLAQGTATHQQEDQGTEEEEKKKAPQRSTRPGDDQTVFDKAVLVVDIKIPRLVLFPVSHYSVSRVELTN